MDLCNQFGPSRNRKTKGSLEFTLSNGTIREMVQLDPRSFTLIREMRIKKTVHQFELANQSPLKFSCGQLKRCRVPRFFSFRSYLTIAVTSSRCRYLPDAPLLLVIFKFCNTLRHPFHWEYKLAKSLKIYRYFGSAGRKEQRLITLKNLAPFRPSL